MTFYFRKGQYILILEKVDKGLIIKLFRDDVDRNLIFSIVKPGNIFINDGGQWKLLDTISIEPVKKYSDYLEKSAYDLNKVLKSYSRVNLGVLDQELITAITYDLLVNRDVSWLKPIDDPEILLQNNQIMLDGRTISLVSDIGLTIKDIRSVVKNRRMTSPILLKPLDSPGPIELIMKNIRTGTPGKYIDPNKILLEAAKEGILEAVMAALNQGADIHFEDDRALILAAQEDHTDIVEYLLDNGADIHAQEDMALRETSLAGNYYTVKMLLKAGADVHANNDQAYQWAYNYKYDDIMELLLKYGANPQVVM